MPFVFDSVIRSYFNNEQFSFLANAFTVSTKRKITKQHLPICGDTTVDLLHSYVRMGAPVSSPFHNVPAIL